MSKRFTLNSSPYGTETLLSLLNGDETLLSVVVNMAITQPDISLDSMISEIRISDPLALRSNPLLYWDKIHTWIKTQGAILRSELVLMLSDESVSIKSVICSYAYVTDSAIYVVVLTENLNLVKRLKRKFARKGKLTL